MINYKNIKNARAKRTTKKEAIANKRKRDQKRKSPTLKTEKAKKARKNEVEITENKIIIIKIKNYYSIL